MAKAKSIRSTHVRVFTRRRVRAVSTDFETRACFRSRSSSSTPRLAGSARPFTLSTTDVGLRLGVEASLKALYRMMLEARVFEQKAYDLFLAGLVAGTSHLAIGQEAIAAAFAHNMRRDDLTYC